MMGHARARGQGVSLCPPVPSNGVRGPDGQEALHWPRRMPVDAPIDDWTMKCVQAAVDYFNTGHNYFHPVNLHGVSS
jgi:hypothetical protein